MWLYKHFLLEQKIQIIKKVISVYVFHETKGYGESSFLYIIKNNKTECYFHQFHLKGEKYE